MGVTRWLIDKSALTRLSQTADAEQWATRVERGLIRLSTVTRMEIGYSSRSADHLRKEFASPPIAWMPIEYLTPAAEDRAFEVLGLLAEQGRHRAPSLADLLIAATAEKTGLTLLHYDRDFELIASITGQPTERLALPEQG